MRAIQDSPTSIILTWSESSDATGYEIHYNSSNYSVNETIDGGDSNSYTVTGLTNGETYTISIAAIPPALLSPPLQATVGLGM